MWLYVDDNLQVSLFNEISGRQCQILSSFTIGSAPINYERQVSSGPPLTLAGK